MTIEIDNKLFNAAQNGDLEKVKKAISEGADVNFVFSDTTTGRNLTPLMVALSNKHIDCFEAIFYAKQKANKFLKNEQILVINEIIVNPDFEHERNTLLNFLGSLNRNTTLLHLALEDFKKSHYLMLTL